MRSLLLSLTLSAGLAMAADPVRIIFDTDMGNDVDDALALSMLHAFESRGEAKILAVTITKDNRWAPLFVDLVNVFYGRGGIPIGIVRNGPTKDDGRYACVVAEKKRPGGAPLYPHGSAPIPACRRRRAFYGRRWRRSRTEAWSLCRPASAPTWRGSSIQPEMMPARSPGETS